jgi:hypothetical protein
VGEEGREDYARPKDRPTVTLSALTHSLTLPLHSLTHSSTTHSLTLPLHSLTHSLGQVVTATLACLSTGAKKDQLAQVEVNQDGA